MANRSLLDLNSIDMTEQHLRERKEKLEESPKTPRTVRKRSWPKIVCRVGIALFLMLVGVALLIFSVSKSRSKSEPVSAKLSEDRKYDRAHQNPPPLDPFHNLTGMGIYRIWAVNGQKVTDVRSTWMQDDVNKRLKITLGIEGTTNWMGDYYFFENSSLVVTPAGDGQNATGECKFSKHGYYEELSQYTDLHLHYSGHHILPEHGNILVDMYTGNVKREGKTEFIERFFDPRRQLQVGTYRFPLNSTTISYEEFWYGDNVTQVVPPEEEFQIPDVCKEILPTQQSVGP